MLSPIIVVAVIVVLLIWWPMGFVYAFAITLALAAGVWLAGWLYASILHGYPLPFRYWDRR